MSLTPRIAREIRRLRRLQAAAERRIAATTFAGKVAEVDAAGRRARLVIGEDEDGAPVLGPWASWEEPAVGSLSVHTPLKVGQQASYASPSGTLGEGTTIRPRAFDDDNPAPSAATDTAVLAFGSTRLEIGSAGLRLVGPVAIEGAGLTHNGTNIGHDHKHTDITVGPDLSGEPQ